MIFNKINCNKIPFKDKGCHFLAGMLTSAMLCFNGLLIASAFASFIVGIAKEVFDKYIRKTKFDIEDVLATGFGGIFFTVSYVMYKGYL